jgi:hypothetical protein
MKGKLIGICAMALGLAIAANPTFAHHGTAAYEEGKQISVTGTVTGFEFANPHTLVFLNVKQGDGTVVKWQGEMTSPNHLVRAGWTRNSLRAGEQITITGLLMKRDARSMWIRKIVKGDGTELPLVME